MANIRVDSPVVVYSGLPLTFKSPADCSQVTGLVVYWTDGDRTSSRVFQFADAHGNNIGHLDLFAADVVVKVILDLATNCAFVQNADTNAYLEQRINNAEANAKSYTDQKVANIPTPDVSGQINTHNSSSTAHNDIRTAVASAQNTANAAKSSADSKAPMYDYGTTDLTAGSSPLESGKLYFVYE